MSTKQIIDEINNLSWEGKLEILNHLKSQAKMTEKEVMEILEKIRGRGKNILGLDAQEYVNKLRGDERI